MTLRHLSTFSGIGGFDLGFERAGMTSVGSVEFDPKCRQVLARHWPDVPQFTDVKEFNPSDGPAFDILSGGFPCQDLSVAGRRAGLAGERSGLFYEFARILDEAKPEWLVLENVSGLLSSAGGRDMGAVLGTLADIGYGVAWRVLDAQFFGVAQRRRRVFLVGHRGDVGRAAEVLLEPEGVRRDSAPGRAPGQVAAAGPAERLGEGGPVAFDWQAGGSGDTTWRGKSRSWIVKQGDYAGSLSTSKVQAIAYGSATASSEPVPDGRVVARSLTAHPGGSRLDGDTDTFVPVAFRKGARDLAVRRLMPVECERLQGFPDGWTDGQSDSARYRTLGNAIAVPVAEWIGRRIAAVQEARRAA